VTFLWAGVRGAWHLLVTGNPYLIHLIRITLQVALVSTGAALVLGLPLGLLLGLGRFRGRGFGMALANAGLGLPPVLIGIILALLMFPAAPLGPLHLLFTLRGVYVAQTVLAFPIVVALTAAAVRAVPNGLFEQARGFDAGRLRVWALALREARIGILTAAIAAVGSALSEVGAIVLVGGNVEGYDQTLASAALQKIGAGDYATGVAIGIVLLGLIFIITATLTVLQSRGAASRVGRSS
jgi:tungstate transport system permease protein